MLRHKEMAIAEGVSIQEESNRRVPIRGARVHEREGPAKTVREVAVPHGDAGFADVVRGRQRDSRLQRRLVPKPEENGRHHDRGDDYGEDRDEEPPAGLPRRLGRAVWQHLSRRPNGPNQLKISQSTAARLRSAVREPSWDGPNL